MFAELLGWRERQRKSGGRERRAEGGRKTGYGREAKAGEEDDFREKERRG